MKTESFDLNLAIQRWRENLAQSPVFRSENLNELESHLRDSVATWRAHGLSDEEAFLIASRRIGGDKQLESEFRKVNGRGVWLDRVFWMLVGLLVWDVVSSFIRTTMSIALGIGWKITNYDYRANGLVFPVVLSTLMWLMGIAGGLVFCWWLFSQKGRKVAKWFHPFLRRPFTLAIGCAVLWTLIFLPRILLPLSFFRWYGPVVQGEIMAPLNISQGIASL